MSRIDLTATTMDEKQEFSSKWTAGSSEIPGCPLKCNPETFLSQKTGVALFSIRSKEVARDEFWSLQRTPDNFFLASKVFSLSGDANGFLEPAAFSAKKCPTCGLQVSLSKECSNVRFQLKRFSFNYNKITFLDLRMLVRWYFKMWSVNIDR